MFSSLTDCSRSWTPEVHLNIAHWEGWSPLWDHFVTLTSNLVFTQT